MRIYGICSFLWLAFALSPVDAQLSKSESQQLQLHEVRPRPVIRPFFDPRAVHLMEEAAIRLRAASTLQAEVETEVRNRDLLRSKKIENVRLVRTGYYELKADVDSTRSSVRVITPQACGVTYFGRGKKKIFSCPVDDGKSLLQAELNAALRGFFDRTQGGYLGVGEWGIQRLVDPLIRSVRYAGKEKWNGVLHDVVEWVYEATYPLPKDTFVYTTRTYLDSDRIVRRVLTTSTKGTEVETQFRKILLDDSIDISSFVVHQTEGEEMDPGSRRTFVGKKFPEFNHSAQLLDGPQVKSSDLLMGKKGALIWFWNTGCGSCIAHMPFLEQVYRRLKTKGIVVIAVNVVQNNDEEIENSRINRFFNGITMPILFNADTWNRILPSRPYVVLDGTGTVIWDGTYELNNALPILERLAGSDQRSP